MRVAYGRAANLRWPWRNFANPGGQSPFTEFQQSDTRNGKILVAWSSLRIHLTIMRFFSHSNGRKPIIRIPLLFFRLPRYNGLRINGVDGIMRQIWMSDAKKGRITIEMAAFRIGNDLLIALDGGLAHIGCLSLSLPDSPIQNLCAKNHKDFIAHEIVISSIKKFCPGTLAVAGGIHFEKITAREIRDCLELCRVLAINLADFLHSGQMPSR